MLLHDTALIYGRYLRQSLRSRFALLFGVLMPLLYLLFFGPLLTDLPLGGRCSRPIEAGHLHVRQDQGDSLLLLLIDFNR